MQTEIAIASEVRVKREKKPVVPTNNQGMLITGKALKWIRIKLQFRLLWIIIRTFPNPFQWKAAFNHIMTLRRNITGGSRMKKVVKKDGRIRMGIYTQPWFSQGFDQFLKSHLNDFKNNSVGKHRFTMVFAAITNKCPLKCDHCYHWDYLNKSGEISTQEWVQIIKKIQEQGVSHIQLSGGEPLLRMDTVEAILTQCSGDSEFWLATSGFGLTQEKANHLKSLGLTGVIISLDHYEESKHNLFRHHPRAFEWVKKAVGHADRAGLTIALSSCLSKDMQQGESMIRFMDLAKSWGVKFVQWLEPMDAGHYSAQDVLLSQERIKKIEKLYVHYNVHEANEDYPIIMYPGYHQRRMGCMFAGNKSIYINSNGHVQACPFCQHDYGKFNLIAPEKLWEEIKAKGCVRFN